MSNEPNNEPSINRNCWTLLVELAKCKPGTGLPLNPSRTKGYRYCMSQGFIERLGVPGILEVTRITTKGRKMAEAVGQEHQK